METTEEVHEESVAVAPLVGPPASTVVVSEAPSNLRWGAIFGGAVAALGVGALLYSLGLALGLSVIDPQDPGSLRPSSIFTGVWAAVVSLIALFVGGFVAARGAGALTRMSGSLHGLVVWGLTVVAGMWLLGSIASTLMSGAATMSRAAAEQMGERMPSAISDAARRAETAVNQRMGDDQRRDETRRDALQVAEDTGKAFWGVFGALLLGMVAAIGGALVGSEKGGRTRPRTIATRDRVEPRVRREAYP